MSYEQTSERRQNSILSVATRHLSWFLLRWLEDRRSIVSNADGDAGARTLIGQTLDACEIKTQSRRANLHAQTRLALRFSAERAAARPRVRAAIHFTGDVELLVDADDACEAVRHDVVLRE